MSTFREVAEYWLKENIIDKIDVSLVFSKIGDIDIRILSSEEIKLFLNYLYDDMKLRGIVFASYEKFVGDICQFAFSQGYISDIPKVEHRKVPDPNVFNQPGSSEMQRLLSHEDCTPAGTILRLAWYCGLLRNEITFLLWGQVDLKIMQIVLPDRKVPLIYEMVLYLSRLFERNAVYSEYVLISQKKSAPMAEQSVSALARKALDNYGQINVRLNDLRCDYIIRALKKYHWEYVSYISGVNLTALQEHYMPFICNDDVIRNDERTEITNDVRMALLDFIKNEGTSMVGLCIRFGWEMGIPVQTLPILTWSNIDFEKAAAVFDDRIIDISDDFLQLLQNAKDAQDGEYNYIILNEYKRKPTNSIYIQKAVQQALINSGLLGITLSTLQYDYWRHHYSDLRKLLNTGDSLEVSSELYSVPKNFPSELIKPSDDKLINYLRDNGSANCKTLKATLGLTEKELSLLLKKCQDEGKVVRVGFSYFLPDVAVRREKHKETILDYVEKHQPVTSAELTELLRLVDRRQIYWIINPIIKSGELIRVSKDKYCVPNYNTAPVTA